jgi:hypothetical protein
MSIVFETDEECHKFLSDDRFQPHSKPDEITTCKTLVGMKGATIEDLTRSYPQCEKILRSANIDDRNIQVICNLLNPPT